MSTLIVRGFTPGQIRTSDPKDPKIPPLLGMTSIFTVKFLYILTFQ